jgi:hypothetical protein
MDTGALLSAPLFVPFGIAHREMVVSFASHCAVFFFFRHSCLSAGKLTLTH